MSFFKQVNATATRQWTIFKIIGFPNMPLKAAMLIFFQFEVVSIPPTTWASTFLRNLWKPLQRRSDQGTPITLWIVSFSHLSSPPYQGWVTTFNWPPTPSDAPDQLAPESFFETGSSIPLRRCPQAPPLSEPLQTHRIRPRSLHQESKFKTSIEPPIVTRANHEKPNALHCVLRGFSTQT